MGTLSSAQLALIHSLFLGSILFILIPFSIMVGKALSRLRSHEVKQKIGISRVLIASACLLFAVWCLRYAVGYYSAVNPGAYGDDYITMTWYEEIVNSLLHAFQTFSMDEGYTEYIAYGKQMMEGAFASVSAMPVIYSVYASVLNFLAPVAGGAILFEILASVFPKVRLLITGHAFWRRKYYFSELNEASLALAKSIVEASSGWKKPIIIFTDTYVDDESEHETEMLSEAKAIGAICVREDILHVSKIRLGRQLYFLMDVNDSGNLETLISLTDLPNSKCLKDAEVYFFTNEDAYVGIENGIIDKLIEQKIAKRLKKLSARQKKREKKNPALVETVQEKQEREKRERAALTAKVEPHLPVIKPIRSYYNMVCNMLTDVPLYEPLIGKKRSREDPADMIVTILGIGEIGTEMFLAAYWFGQMLDCRLTINVLSKEGEQAFWNKIDYINPEIRRTTRKSDPILNIYEFGAKDAERSPVYCTVHYYQCDVQSTGLIELLTGNALEEVQTERQTDDRMDLAGSNVKDSQYFFVSLGSDRDNISVANTIRKYVGERHIEQYSQNREINRAVINYVVYDTDLADALNCKKKHQHYDKNITDVYMCAVGNLRDVYSIRNVFMENHLDALDGIQARRDAIENKKSRLEKQSKRRKKEYEYRSSLARAMHVLYKAFSAGNIKLPSVFEMEEGDLEGRREALKTAKESYQKIACGMNDTTDIALLHRLAWLEHRRWSAFMRTYGFRHVNDYHVYESATGNYKQMDLKLHPCLVECDEGGIHAYVGEQGVISGSVLDRDAADMKLDLLDTLTLQMRGATLPYDVTCDFKFYDYPREDFDKERMEMKMIDTPNAPKAIGPYSQGVVIGNMVYTSGQIAIIPNKKEDKDKPELLLEGDITAQTERVCRNITAILEAAGSSPAHVVKTTCFLADMNDFAAFNAVYEKCFTGKPARSCVAVKTLPKNVLVEVEAIAIIR